MIVIQWTNVSDFKLFSGYKKKVIVKNRKYVPILWLNDKVLQNFAILYPGRKQAEKIWINIEKLNLNRKFVWH